MSNRQPFEAEWPPVANRLHAALRHRRVPRAMTEDLVQETGLRLFEIWQRVDPERDIWPLALTIALNVLRDHIRAQTRWSKIAVPDMHVDHDAEVIALARVELEQVHAALDQLTAGQRSALLAEIGAAKQPDESASSLKMLRLRARKRLRTLMDGASAAIGSLELALQRLWRSTTPSSPLNEQLIPCMSVAAGLICAATLGGMGAAVDGSRSNDAKGGTERTIPQRSEGLGWIQQTASLTIGKESSAWLRAVGRGVRLEADGAGGEESTRRVIEIKDRGTRVRPTGPTGPKRPGGNPPAGGIRIKDPRAEVGPDGYRVEGGGDARVADQRFGALVEAASGDDESSPISGAVGGPGAPQASADVEVGDVGDFEVSSTGERSSKTATPTAPLETDTGTD